MDFVRNIERNLASSEIIKDSRSVEAGICVFRSGRLFVKRYNDRGVIHRIRHMLKVPRAHNAARIFSHLKDEAAEIFIPAHIGVVCRRRPGLGQRFSYLIQEAVDDLVPTLEIVKLASSSDEERRRLTGNLSDTLARMHEAGVIHGDAKMTNFLFKKVSGGYICGMWDFDIARIRAAPPAGLRERDLARVAASLIEISEGLSCGWSRSLITDELVAGYEEQSACRLQRASLGRKIRNFLG
jgi:tRNA A-37 threonylcarbamoyl transferase component Bud32